MPTTAVSLPADLIESLSVALLAGRGHDLRDDIVKFASGEPWPQLADTTKRFSNREHRCRGH
jgi:hypothetical protein